MNPRCDPGVSDFLLAFFYPTAGVENFFILDDHPHIQSLPSLLSPFCYKGLRHWRRVTNCLLKPTPTARCPYLEKRKRVCPLPKPKARTTAISSKLSHSSTCSEQSRANPIDAELERSIQDATTKKYTTW